MTRRERYVGRTSGMRFNLGMAIPPRDEPIDDAAALRWWQSTRSDPWFKIEIVPRTSAAAMRAFMDVSPRSLDYALLGLGVGRDRPTGATTQALAKIMRLVESGQLVFTREKTLPPSPFVSYLWSLPASQPFPQHKLLSREDYQWFSRCRSCGGRRFAAIYLNHQRWAACWDCLPPHVYGTFGASPDPRRLVMDRIDGLRSQELAMLESRLRETV